MAQAALPILRARLLAPRAPATLTSWFSQLGVGDCILVAGAALIVFHQLVRCVVRFPHWAWMVR